MKLDQLFSIEGKTAVVTGGSRGIGEMITLAFWLMELKFI